MLESLKSQKDLHLTRKLFHFISILGVLMCITFWSRPLCWTVYFLVGVPLVLMDLARPHFASFNRLSLKIIGPVIRKHEVRHLSGSSYAIIGIGLTYFLFPLPIAQLAVLFLAVGDPTASYFGLRFGKHKMGKKSLEGFIAGFFFCSLSALIFMSLLQIGQDLTNDNLVFNSLLYGFIGAIAEFTPALGVDDNLSQPLLSATLLSLLFWATGGLS